MHAEAASGPPLPDAHAVPDTPRIVVRMHPDMPLLAFPEGVALEVLADPVSIRIPNTRPWFDGAVGLRGNLLPLFDIALWAGHRPATGQRRLLAVSSSRTPFALVSAEIPQLLTIAPDTTHATHTAEIAAAAPAQTLAPYLGAAHRTALGTVHDFDMQAWVAELRRDLAGTTSA